MSKIKKSEQEWQKQLTPEQYRILRNKGTEPAFSGKYYHFNKTGVYNCAACGNPLFRSTDKFDSGSGWPSFTQPISAMHVDQINDHSHHMQRIEVICHRCDSHLGHVFTDGPKPTGLRYCINSLALNFEEKEDHDA